MKICHIITRMIVGGAQENTLLSLRGAMEAGHHCVLLTGPTAGPEGKLLQQSRLPDLELVECPFLVREISPLKELLALIFLIRYLKREQFDVVHTHSSKAGILGRIAARIAGVPCVVHTIHGQAFHRYEKPWKNRLYIALEKLASKYCDRIFAVAQAMIDQSLAAGIGTKELYRVVYSGMDLAPFLQSKPERDLRTRLGIPPRARVIGTLARLFEMKGYEELFSMAPALIKACPDLHFLIIGDGILREKLEETARKQGFADHVSFAGLVPPAEVYRYLALIDILAHFSLREGLPRAAVQALASGKPVAAFALDGTPEVVLDGETGFLIPPQDLKSAEDALIRLLGNEELCRKMGDAGRRLVETKFDWHRMSGTLLSEYSTLLERKS